MGARVCAGMCVYALLRMYVCIGCFRSNAHYCTYWGVRLTVPFFCIFLAVSRSASLCLSPSADFVLSRFRVFRRIKEQHCYCAPDLAKEYSKYDTDPRKFFRKYTGKRVRRGRRGGAGGRIAEGYIDSKEGLHDQK